MPKLPRRARRSKELVAVRELIGHQRYEGPEELELLNQFWKVDRIFTNYLFP